MMTCKSHIQLWTEKPLFTSNDVFVIRRSGLLHLLLLSACDNEEVCSSLVRVTVRISLFTNPLWSVHPPIATMSNFVDGSRPSVHISSHTIDYYYFQRKGIISYILFWNLLFSSSQFILAKLKCLYIQLCNPLDRVLKSELFSWNAFQFINIMIIFAQTSLPAWVCVFFLKKINYGSQVAGSRRMHVYYYLDRNCQAAPSPKH